MTLDELSEKMKSQNITPQECAEYVMQLTGWYSTYETRLEKLIGLSFDYFSVNRQDYKSDKACENAWNNTPDGREMTNLKMRMKKIEKMISAFKTMLRLKENELRNML